MDASKQIEKAKEFIENIGNYYEKLLKKSRENKNNLVINFMDIVKFDPLLADMLLEQPEEALKAFDIAASEVADEDLHNDFSIRIKNLPNITKLQINKVRSDDLEKYITIEGIIKQKSDVKAHITKAIFECPACGTLITILQLDERKFQQPTKCKCGRKGHFLVVSKEKVDVYSMAIEEPTDYMEGGTKLSQIKILCKKGLANPKIERLLYQGMRVEISGILKELQITKNGILTSKIDWYLEANYIKPFDETFMNIKWDENEVKTFKELAERDDWLSALTHAIFYDIEGYKEETEGITLQMFSGVGIDREGMRVRGNWHILLVGDPGCIRGHELITMADGTFRRISSFGEKHLQNIKHKVRINRINANDGSNRNAITFFKYLNQKTKIIITETGKELGCSYNHPLHVKRKRGFVWIKAEHLKIGDQIKTIYSTLNTKINYIPLEKIEVCNQGKDIEIEECTEDFAYLCGYVMGDGSVTKPNTKQYYRTTIYIVEDEFDLVEKITKILDTIQLKYTIKEPKLTNGTINGRSFIRKKRLKNIVINNKILSNLLKKESDRRIQDYILSSPKKVVASYLSGLFDADGSIFKTKHKNRSCKGAIQLKSIYPRLLQDVLTLLTSFKIQARINKDNLVIKRTEDIKSFIKYIGFKCQKKIRKSEEILKELDCVDIRKRRFVSKERIISIKDGPIETVYDIEVEKAHRFISNGIVSHNSAKSSMLKIATKFAPKARYIAGTGVSGPGLTATVVKDELIGGFTLEGGALVLCNNGLCCIDELDKIDDEYKKALHEPLADETISIDKANVHATLIAQTSVLAAANPKLGSYSDYIDLYSQLNLSPTLINRFDMVYPIKEGNLTTEDDYKIARKILARGTKEEKTDVEFSREFIKKYISYARTIAPTLPDDIQEYIAKQYQKVKEVKRRTQSPQNVVPINARNIDGFRRVIESVARSRLHPIVTKDDASIGYKKVIYSISQLGIDPDSGEVTSENVGGGKVWKKKDIAARLITIIRDRTTGNGPPMEGSEIFEILKSDGIDDELLVEEIIRSLKNSGDIFEPRNDYYKVL